jgi:hypothetical protein
MSGSSDESKVRFKSRVVAFIDNAACPLLAAAIRYRRVLETVPILLWRSAKFAAEVDFWSTLLGVAIAILSDPMRASLLAVAAILWWALVLIRHQKSHAIAESPDGTPPIINDALSNVVDFSEFRMHKRRREDRGAGGRHAA